MFHFHKNKNKDNMGVFISVVDKSARLYISRILPFIVKKEKEGKEKRNGGMAEIFTTSGEISHYADVKCVSNLDRFSVIGIPDIRRIFPEILKVLRFFASESHRIDRAIFADSPDLNIFFGAILKSIKNGKIKNFYFIPPTVWAWREERKKLVERFFDKILYIFPFEKDIWKNGIYVGHPLCKIIKEEIELGIIKNKKARRNIKSKSKSGSEETAIKDTERGKRTLKIAFLPGSRYSELINHRDIIMELPKKISGVFLTPTDFPEFFRNSEIKIFPSHLSRFIMSESDIVIAASGSSNLESALLGKPLIVFYKLPQHVFEIAKNLVKIKYISLPNIILGKKIFPELIQSDATPERISEEVEKLKNSGEDFSKVQEKLLGILDGMEFREIAEIFMS